jgi:SAM-dependent methyltransferase
LNKTLADTADAIARCCGLGTVRYCGINPVGALDALLEKSFDVRAFTTDQEQVVAAERRFPGRCVAGSLDEMLAEYTDILIVDALLDTLSSGELTGILPRLGRCARYIALRLSAVEIEGVRRNREWWEARCIEAGMRRHPRGQHIVPYWKLNEDPDAFLLVMERIPEKALALYPLETLRAERDLHMDMLREAGRRSDAHMARYHFAAQYVRPGDTVLDCACGLGYGSHIIYQNSRAHRVIGIDNSGFAIAYAKSNYCIPGSVDFFQGDALGLVHIPEDSIDYVTGFETIEHIPEPARYLKELFRVLRPSGRIFLSAPHQWVDENGNDPNPDHLHVYSWERLYSEISVLFLPEKGFIQIAGGSLTLTNSVRAWEEIPCRPSLEKEAEWVLLLAMKDPLLGRSVPYVETTFPQSDDPAWHVGAFGKDYINPWLLKGMISIGYRLNNRELLNTMQKRVLADYPPDSVDYGAALCGQAYMLLDPGTTQPVLDDFMARMEAYVACANPNPHAMRWKVSLLYAAAMLKKARGDLQSAETLFLRCATYDVLPYSALLGVKISDALYHAALFAIARGEKEEAAKRLKKAMTETQRLAQGPWLNIVHNEETPFEPGFPEMAQLMDKASRACYALGELPTLKLRPGLTYSIGVGWYEGFSRYYIKLVEEQQNQIVAQQCWITNCKNEISSYVRSKSWKLTAPLRKIASLLRAL